MPDVPPDLSAYFSRLAEKRHKKLGRKGRVRIARLAGKAAWAKLSKRQRSLEMKRRARARKRNKVAARKLNAQLLEKIRKRKAGLDE